jgi:ribosomal protein S18 acetylase RimI-like enzyme
MSKIHIERAGVFDTRDMAELLNEIIQIGGTTAFLEAITPETIQGWMTRAGDRGTWHIARDDSGKLLGIQWIEPHPVHGPDVAQIASFVQVGQTGLGIGSKLFETTKLAAKAAEYHWIDATIRADNESGLTYYQSRGFETYKRDPNAALSDGRVVGKISKRYDL